ncbi:guanine deaminase, partial [Psychrobacter sp. AOP7-B1-24]
MTIHIYQAQLLHYLTEDDLAARSKKTNTAAEGLKNPSPLNITAVEKNVTLQPVIAGVNIHPEYIADGALVVDDATGRVLDYGHCAAMMSAYAHTQEGKEPVQVHNEKHKLIMPGFIDTHVHYPQIDMIAAFGEQLLDWLN